MEDEIRDLVHEHCLRVRRLWWGATLAIFGVASIAAFHTWWTASEYPSEFERPPFSTFLLVGHLGLGPLVFALLQRWFTTAVVRRGELVQVTISSSKPHLIYGMGIRSWILELLSLFVPLRQLPYEADVAGKRKKLMASMFRDEEPWKDEEGHVFALLHPRFPSLGAYLACVRKPR